MLKRKLKESEKTEVKLIISLLKRGEEYSQIIERFSRSGQTLSNAERYLEERVIAYLNEENRTDLYDFIASTCVGFPTFKLARNIAITKLTKKEFIKVNSITPERYETAYNLFQKIPAFIELHENIGRKLDEVNSCKMVFSYRKRRV